MPLLLNTPQVRTGSTVLIDSRLSDIAGLRVGFIGNHTSNLTNGTSTVMALIAAGVKIVRLFSPEHGAHGKYDDKVGNESDPSTGLPIVSLYGDHRKPLPEMLADLDILLFELQDVGARFYTYLSTLLLAIDAADESGMRLIVLDRPNPITGVHFEGPSALSLSFTAAYNIPLRHGLTLGELATLYTAEKSMTETLAVIPCEELSRSMWFDQTGLGWVDPSPAMRSLATATVYPGVCLLEQTNVSVGRGTEAPFQLIGAPFIDGELWAERLTSMNLPAMGFSASAFTPTASKYAGEKCNGVKIDVYERDQFLAVQLGIALLISLADIYGSRFDLRGARTLFANDKDFEMMSQGANIETLTNEWRVAVDAWKARITPYLLY